MELKRLTVIYTILIKPRVLVGGYLVALLYLQIGFWYGMKVTWEKYVHSHETQLRKDLETKYGVIPERYGYWEGGSDFTPVCG